ncbi:hypothetical protein NKR19_g8402 [Coniochaeta hoffmannii]|uniref:Uncharacterized protein n=1 Tax=Coniochaeta hoffmannii TaxID=91930 RepID=A0AA38RQ91_9PEZI|nr:hypothetical protein NKR19_g8402 [Coniochaeta hoffmannii]
MVELSLRQKLLKLLESHKKTPPPVLILKVPGIVVSSGSESDESIAHPRPKRYTPPPEPEPEPPPPKKPPRMWNPVINESPEFGTNHPTLLDFLGLAQYNATCRLGELLGKLDDKLDKLMFKVELRKCKLSPKVGGLDDKQAQVEEVRASKFKPKPGVQQRTPKPRPVRRRSTTKPKPRPTLRQSTTKPKLKAEGQQSTPGSKPKKVRWSDAEVQQSTPKPKAKAEEQQSTLEPKSGARKFPLKPKPEVQQSSLKPKPGVRKFPLKPEPEAEQFNKLLTKSEAHYEPEYQVRASFLFSIT